MPADDEVEACVLAEYGRLVGVVAVVTGSRSTAEDAVQEAFAKAWERTAKGHISEHRYQQPEGNTDSFKVVCTEAAIARALVESTSFEFP